MNADEGSEMTELERLRQEHLAYVKHPVDLCGYEGGCGARQSLDKFEAGVRADERGNLLAKIMPGGSNDRD